MQCFVKERNRCKDSNDAKSATYAFAPWFLVQETLLLPQITESFAHTAIYVKQAPNATTMNLNRA